MSVRLQSSERAKFYGKSLILCNRGLRISFPPVVTTADGAYKNASGNLPVTVGVEWQFPMLSKPTPPARFR
jgi:hypothetical protein